jgi:hypothetical protein
MKKILIIILFTYFNSTAATIYVNSSATGSNNGISWNNAYTNLQEALSNAIFGDQIWVASGTYKTTTTTDRTLSFSMRNGVNLYGGFSGVETAINQRNISLNPTTLSGDIGAFGDNSDNTNTILKVISITSGLTIDGFRIISGRGSGCAGIALNNNTGIININNCFFFDNFGGTSGAIFLAYQGNYTVNVLNCDFISNISVNGVIFTDTSNNNLNVIDCRFRGSVSGGVTVLDFLGANLTVDKCIVTNNTATQTGLFYIDANSSAKISNSLFVGNSYKESAILFYSSSSAIQIAENITVAHNKKTFSTNDFYTSIYSINGVAKVYNSIIFENTNSSNNIQINFGNQSGNIVENSIVENGYATGTNILITNPLFTNPNNLISAPFDCSNYDYSLQSNSQGINFGNNNFVTKTQDIIGNTRIQQTNVDLGAYENIGNLSIEESTYINKNLYYDYFNEVLNLKNIDSGKIEIYDIYGKLVNTLDIKEKIYLSYLKSGIYIVILKEYNERLKIIKK